MARLSDSSPPVLHGYRFSVFAWIARLACHEKGVSFTWSEIDPFEVPLRKSYLDLNPFRRVPTLVHGDFTVYETSAITQYLDDAFDGPSLMPDAPPHRARVRQFMSLVSGDVYWPLVRQVFAHGFWRERTGRGADPIEVRCGLDGAAQILPALEQLAGGGNVLVGDTLSLADLHLAPMIGYFCESDSGAEMLAQQPRLSQWWAAISVTESYLATRPDLTGVLE